MNAKKTREAAHFHVCRGGSTDKYKKILFFLEAMGPNPSLAVPDLKGRARLSWAFLNGPEPRAALQTRTMPVLWSDKHAAHAHGAVTAKSSENEDGWECDLLRP